MIAAVVVALALVQQTPPPAQPTIEQAATWPLIAEDGAVQRRRGPLMLGSGDSIAVWTAALPRPEHAATLGAAFRRFEVDCPGHKIRRAEGFSLAPGEASPTPTDSGDTTFAYPGSQPRWVARLLTDICAPAD